MQAARSWDRLWEEQLKPIGIYLHMDDMARALLCNSHLTHSLKVQWYRRSMQHDMAMATHVLHGGPEPSLDEGAMTDDISTRSAALTDVISTTIMDDRSPPDIAAITDLIARAVLSSQLLTNTINQTGDMNVSPITSTRSPSPPRSPSITFERLCETCGMCEGEEWLAYTECYSCWSEHND